MASPETSRRDSGEATPRRILLELPPEPTDGARVLLVDGDHDLGRRQGAVPRHRIDPGDFGPVLESIAPSVLPPGPRPAPGAAGPLLPEEILAASGRPGEPRPTPQMSALDWVRVFGPLGSEDRTEGDSDAPGWAPPVKAAAPSDAHQPTPPEARPPGETAGVVTSGLTDLSLMALLDELAPVRGPAAPPEPAPAAVRTRSGRRRRWLPAAAAVAVVAVPATAVLAALVLAHDGDGTTGTDVGSGSPTGTTTPPAAG